MESILERLHKAQRQGQGPLTGTEAGQQDYLAWKAFPFILHGPRITYNRGCVHNVQYCQYCDNT